MKMYAIALDCNVSPVHDVHQEYVTEAVIQVPYGIYEDKNIAEETCKDLNRIERLDFEKHNPGETWEDVYSVVEIQTGAHPNMSENMSMA